MLKKLSLLCSAFLLTANALAQSSVPYGSFPFPVYDVQELINGNIYAATDSGLYVASHPFVQWNRVTVPGTSSGFSPRILEGVGWQLWVGTEGEGVYRLNNTTWAHYDTSDGLSSNFINDISIAPNSDVWLATDEGLSVKSGAQWSAHYPFNDSVITAVECIGATVFAGNAAFNEAVKRYTGSTWTFLQGPTLSKNSVRRLKKGTTTTLMVSHAGGASTYTAGTWVHLTYLSRPTFVSHANPNNLLAHESGRFLIRWDGNGVDTIPIALTNFASTVFALSDGESDHSAWLVEDDAGMYRIHYVDFEPRPVPPSIGRNLVGILQSNGQMFDNSLNPSAPWRSGLRYGNHYMSSLAGLWLAVNDGGVVRGAVSEYLSQGSDWHFGPVGDVTDLNYSRRFNRVWEISRAEIENHKSQWNQSGYQMPEVIQNWPGNGDTTKGEAWILAPFIDLNLNGKYEPNQGEYPDVRGEDVVFAISNDWFSTTNNVNGSPLGVEVHTMLYTLDTTGWDLADDALFVHIEIKARKGDLTGLRMGINTSASHDGTPYVDLASDSLGNMMVFLESDGTEKRLGFVALSDTLDGVIGLMDVDQSNPGSRPATNAEYWHVLNAHFKDGMPISQPSSQWGFNNYIGYDTSSTGPFTRFQMNYSILWKPAHQWWYGGLALFPTVDITAGGSHCMDFAYVYSDEPFPTYFADTNLLQDFRGLAQTVMADFQSKQWSCLGEGLSAVEYSRVEEWNSAYPNPTSGLFRLEGVSDVDAHVFNSMGQSFGTVPVRSGEADISHFPAGMYIVQFTVGDQVGYVRLIKQ